jgi:hypothetical protein
MKDSTSVDEVVLMGNLWFYALITIFACFILFLVAMAFLSRTRKERQTGKTFETKFRKHWEKK